MPYLAFNLNDGNEFVFDLLEDRLSIGRDSRNDIVIDNAQISGFHAEFLRQPDGVYELVDLKSSNGTFINGKRVTRERVKGGDRLQFGQLESKFRDRAPKGLAPTDVKPGSPSGGKPHTTREDGRRGDTESINLGLKSPSSLPEALAADTSEATTKIAVPIIKALVIAKPAASPSPALSAADIKIIADLNARREAAEKATAEAEAKMAAAKKQAAELGKVQSELEQAKQALAKVQTETAAAEQATKETEAAQAKRAKEDTQSAEKQIKILQQESEAAKAQLDSLKQQFATETEAAKASKAAEEKAASKKLKTLLQETEAAQAKLDAL
ncbi:MAG: hypothetical protein JWO08_3139, partial [Verrucomicrobiaceae bacterium]|nr:hypothetical protein [Verrucomicrobiaceae bacterium]